MEYYNALNFKKEPFSNSPEPEFFFEVPKHMGCLQKLELAVRLRRGLNVVIGDVGTGKTTLCRKLLQQLSFSPKNSQEIETHLFLDPSVNSTIEFLQTVGLLLGIPEIAGQESEWQLKEKIKNYLFNKGVNENKTVVLIIDEGQKVPENCIEILREFLNYETNNFKLLQIIIFAQLEFKKMLREHANLSDRINILYYLNPLSFKHTRQMIKYRISVARNFENTASMFTFWGYVAIYLATGGYPRKVVSLCHQVVLMMIIRGSAEADFFLVKDCLKDSHNSFFSRIKWTALGALIIAAFILTGGFVFQNKSADYWQQLNISKIISDTRQKLADKIAPEESLTKNDLPLPSNIPAIPVDTEKATAVATAQMTETQKTPGATAKSPAEKEPPNAPANIIHNVKMPDSLGILIKKKGRTLWRAVTHIYGEANSEIMAAIMKANPHVNKANIAEGEKINLPAIPASIRPVQEGNYVVMLKRGNDLDEMYDFFHENYYKQKMLHLAFFSFWSSKDGLIFTVIIDKNFNNLQRAQEALNELPSSIAAKAQVVSSWDKNTIFFNRQALKQ